MPSTGRPMPHAVRCGPPGSGGSPSKGPPRGRSRPQGRTSGGLLGRGMPLVLRCGPPESLTGIEPMVWAAWVRAPPMARTSWRAAVKFHGPGHAACRARTRVGRERISRAPTALARKRIRPTRTRRARRPSTACRARRPSPAPSRPLRRPAVPVRVLGTPRVRRCARPWRRGDGPSRRKRAREFAAPALRAGPRHRPVPERGIDPDGTRAAMTPGSGGTSRRAGRSVLPTVCVSVTYRACLPVPS